MSSNWANNLDMLSQNGVLNFDAPSYITGQSPRYVGTPGLIKPYTQMPNPVLPEAAKIDEFKSQKAGDTGMIKNPAWKKWLTLGAVLTFLVLGGLSLRAISKKGFGSLKNIFKFDKGAFKNIKTESTDGLKNLKGWFSNLFKRFKK